MSALYELTAELAPLRAALDACEVNEDGAVQAPPDLLDVLDRIEADYAAKIDACARVVRSLEAEADMVAVEADRLDKRAQALLANAERLKEAMRRSLVATQTNAVKGPGSLFTVSLRKGSERVEVTDLAAVPADLRRAPPPPPPPAQWPPDKAEAAKRLKAGEQIPGLTIVRGEPTLSIR